MTNGIYDLETCAKRLAGENRGDWQRALDVFMLALGHSDPEAMTIQANYTGVDIEQAIKRHCDKFHVECEELATRTGTKYVGRS
jgi:hypothetical protein